MQREVSEARELVSERKGSLAIAFLHPAVARKNQQATSFSLHQRERRFFI